MEDKAIKILDSLRIMAIATNRPDGWPQNTVVGYANDGLLIYFMISRQSQKFENIQKDNRVALAIAREPADFHQLKAVFAGAEASEVTNEDQRQEAWRLLTSRHPNLLDYEMPARSEAALMRAICRHVSILDFTKGLGHANELTVGVGGVSTMESRRLDDWGLSKLKAK
jgi:nitroimidazol reductase NimA-like FMN-containing flavoprotein (pyridoxamine 5'-phosphate oxidase superfamily)